MTDAELLRFGQAGEIYVLGPGQQGATSTQRICHSAGGSAYGVETPEPIPRWLGGFDEIVATCKTAYAPLVPGNKLLE